MSSLKVSIIMPVYNAEKFIRSTIKQIQSQTLDGFECILIDDKSSDGTAAIVDASIVNDNRFIFQKHEVNLGKVKTLNEGLQLAKGEFVQFLDDDDEYSKDLLQECCAKMERDRLDVLFSNYDRKNLRTGNITTKACTTLHKLPSRVFSVKDIQSARYENIFLEYAGGEIWTKMFRRDFLIHNKIVFRDFFPSDDIVFNAEAALSARRLGKLDKSFITWKSDDENSGLGNIDKYPTGPIRCVLEVKNLLQRAGLYSTEQQQARVEKFLILTMTHLMTLNYKNIANLYKVFEIVKTSLNLDIKEIPDKYYNGIRDLLISSGNSEDFFFRLYKSQTRESGNIIKYNESRIEDLERQLAAVKNSRAYRLGRVLTAPARLLRRKG